MIEQKIKPMLCKSAEKKKLDWLDNKWIIEPKYDGSRNLLFVDFENNYLRVQHRSLADYTRQYPELSLEQLKDVFNNKIKSAILDGEIVADSFSAVLSRNHLQDEQKILIASKVNPIRFIAFDLLMLNGKDLRKKTLQQRKQALEKAIYKRQELIKVIKYEERNRVSFADIYDLMVSEYGFEGVVAKRLSSKYSSRRSESWLKIKELSTEDLEILGFDTKSKSRKAQSVGVEELILITPKGRVRVPNKNDKDYFYKNNPKMAEVQHQPNSEYEQMRFPVFVRFREAK